MRSQGTLMLAASVLALAAPVEASYLLTAGKVGTFGRAADGSPTALVRVTGDPVLDELPDPRCPARSTAGFAFATQAQVRTDHGETVLPCANWHATASGFRYHDPSGTAAGVREILYGPGHLFIRAGGPSLTAVTGPVIYVEAFFAVGPRHWVVRLYDFRRNDAERIVSRRPSHTAAAAEAATWDSLWGSAAREAPALALLARAIRERPSDGRSQFYLGALHMYRAARAFYSGQLDAAALADQHAALAPLDRAAELLPHDSVPKVFRAFTIYLNGIFDQDADETARGLALMEEATTENLFFNKAVDLFILPIFMSGSSDSYQSRLMPWLDDVYNDAVAHPDVYPDVFTSRLVPHDPESAMLMFGDVALKGGRLDLAARYYGLAQAFGKPSGYPFESIADSRLADVEARLAAHETVAPSDGGMPGVSGVSPCTLCHYGAR